MTQAISIPMLMSGADSGLKPDTATASGPEQGNVLQSSDAERSTQGSGFSALLNGMVQPAKSGKSIAEQRQLLAGSGLSVLSAAMLQATDSSDAATETDLTLANNLLLQIAFGNQNAEADTDSASQVASGEEAETDAADDDILLQLVPGSDEQTADEPLSKRVVAMDTAKAEQGAEIKQSLNAFEVKSTAPEAGSDATDADAGAGVKLSATGSEPVTTASDKADPVRVKVAAVTNKQSDSAAAKPTTAESNTAPQQELTTNQQQAITANTLSGDQQIAESGLRAELIKEAGKTIPAKDTAAETKAAMSVEPMTGADADVPADSKSVGVAAAMTAANNADSDSSKAEAKKATAPVDNDSARAVKTDAVTSSKASTNEQGAQQQHQQQSNLAQTERQLAESGAVSNKASIETVNRGEQSFTASLQAAEQRQQAHSAKATVKTVSEQLKQAINLQQHDAAGQLRERVNLMVRQNIQVAEIRLDPAGLGQMQIKVDMQQEQANVQFIVQQPQAKELLEQQLPRLREMLQQQGLMLGEGSVQQQSQQERQLNERQQQQHGGKQQGSADNFADDEPMPVQLRVAAADRLVDYYA